MKIEQGYTKAQMTWLMMLRLFIGWHFMYEGLVKIMNPKWTSLPYLLDSKGPAASFFIKLTQDDSLMTTINFLNEWALLLIRPRLDFRLFVSFIFCWRYDSSRSVHVIPPLFRGSELYDAV